MILNRSRMKPICEKVEMCRGLLSQAKGLMFRKKLDGGFLIDFGRENSEPIWTMGMRFPIDIVWIDAGWYVVDTAEDAKPWRFYRSPKRKAKMVLELNAGAISHSGTRVGDYLELF